jgi:hypothetical protein
MNKKGLLGKILIIGFIIVFFSLMTYGLHLENKEHLNFCESNGFEYYEKANWRGQPHLCIKIEDGYRVEKKYNNCGKEFCFIKQDANVLEGEE